MTTTYARDFFHDAFGLKKKQTKNADHSCKRALAVLIIIFPGFLLNYFFILEI